MRIGVARIEIFIESAGSLKDKRMVLKSLKDRIRARFNVSVAEVEAGDKWQRAVLGVAAVSKDLRYLSGELDRVVEFVRGEKRVTILDLATEII